MQIDENQPIKQDIEMIVNNDQIMQSIIKEENDPAQQIAYKQSSVSKSDTKLSVHKPNIKHLAPMTPSLSSKLKCDIMKPFHKKMTTPVKCHTAPLEIKNNDKIMHSVVVEGKPSKVKHEKSVRKRRRRSKHNKKKSVILEYFKKSHEFNVIIGKHKVPESARPLSKTISKIEIKEESIDKKDLNKSIKNLKVKNRSKNSSKSKTKRVETPKLKASLTINDKLLSLKSTKRVLLKTINSKEKNPRQLRSGTKLGNVKTEKAKSSLRTRSQKKGKSSVKKEKSTSKRKVISKLVEAKK
jgi:hypothetical protein